MILGARKTWLCSDRLLATVMFFCLNASLVSPVYAAPASATINATILPRSDVSVVSTDAITEIAARTWAQLLYSGSAGVLTFTIPGSGSATSTTEGGKHCSCRLTGSVEQIAALVSCNNTSFGNKSRSCQSSVNTAQLAKLMTCSGAEEYTEFCRCTITGSVEQIAALLFCNGTLTGSKVVSIMVTSHPEAQTEKSAAIIVAYN